MEGGSTVRAYIAQLRRTAEAVKAANDPALGATGERLMEALEHLSHTTEWLLKTNAADPERALAGATPYLRLFGLAAGGCLLADNALAALRERTVTNIASRAVPVARFFGANLASAAGGLAATVIEGAEGFKDVTAEQLG
jgi:hypothetical protein